MTSPICACCGHNMEAERPIVAGRFAYSPGGGFEVDGERLKVEPACHAMIGAVMAGRGRVMRTEGLAERQSDQLTDPRKTVDSYVYRLRRALELRDVDPPFERVPCVGLRWTGPEVERLAA